MKRIILVTLIILSSPLHAADLGVDGEVFTIGEPDLIEAIHAELGAAEADGRLAAFNGKVEGQAHDAFSAQPSLNLPRALRPSSRLYDPSITVQRDIRTHTGELIAARGTYINPLNQTNLRQPLIFVDGRDAEQMAWASRQQGKIILTGGNPKQLMEDLDMRLYFDQKGVLIGRFGINALPTRISQSGLMLKIEEIPLNGDKSHEE